MLSEMRSIAPKIHTLVDWTREFLALAEMVLSRGETLKAAYYYRSAEFFMPPTGWEKPEEQETQKKGVRYVITS
jgi:hypothetical protein